MTDNRSSSLQWADSHAHVSDLPNPTELIARARAACVTHIVNICTDLKSLNAGLPLASPTLCNVGATTPHDVALEGESMFDTFAAAARSGQLAAVGETGLDYHYAHSPRELQRTFLIRYLHLAQETNLPVVFHCREAFSDLFAICDAEYRGPAILHCFTGTQSEADEVLKRGWHISFSGIVTFKKSEPLRAVARTVPLSHLLLETDSPYLAPQSRRGEPNEPSFLPEIGACLAALHNCPVADIARATTENVCRLFFKNTLR